jgi:hypothetical protein
MKIPKSFNPIERSKRNKAALQNYRAAATAILQVYHLNE